MLWQGVLEQNRQAFSQKYNLRLVTPEGGWTADPLNSLQRIQNWQEDVDFSLIKGRKPAGDNLLKTYL